MDLEIVKTDTPQRDLLLLADESEESVADYADRGTTYVARRDGEILGQYVFLHTRPFTAEVVNIAVVPEHQRKGIATAMLRHAVATARAAGFHLLALGTGVSKSVRAIWAWDRLRSTNAAGSSAAASTWTISANTTPFRFSKTASSAATWCACAWNSNNRLCRSVGTRGTDAASSAKAAGTATSTGRMRRTSREVRRTTAFNLPVRRTRDGRYKVPPGEMVYTCFTSDFLVEEADAWRAEAWEMIRIRSDLRFFFITKRIDRLMQVLPPDWGGGYENLAVGCTVENQAMADYRLPFLLDAPLRHKLIICAPLLGPLDIARYLVPGIEEVSVGGESGNEARPCNYDWILSIRRQCVAADIPFAFHQTGARLVKDGRLYRIRRPYQHSQARKAGIDYKAKR